MWRIIRNHSKDSMKNTSLLIATITLLTSIPSHIACKGTNDDASDNVKSIAIGSVLFSVVAPLALADRTLNKEGNLSLEKQLQRSAFLARGLNAINDIHLYGNAAEIAWANANNMATIPLTKAPSDDFANNKGMFYAFLALKALVGFGHATSQAAATQHRNIKHALYYRAAHALSQAVTLGELFITRSHEKKENALLLSRALYFLFSSYNTLKMIKDPLARIDAFYNGGHNGRIIADKSLSDVEHTAHETIYHYKLHDIHPNGDRKYIALFDGEKGIYIPLDDSLKGQYFTYHGTTEGVSFGNKVDLTHALLPLDGYDIRFSDLTEERLLKLAAGLGVIRIENIDDIQFPEIPAA
jgi:hypothetical protein